MWVELSMLKKTWNGTGKGVMINPGPKLGTKYLLKAVAPQ